MKVGLIAVLAGAVSAPVFAQQPSTARLAGVVVTSDAGATPVGRAIVTISGAEAGRQTIADDEGRFEFAGLPPGRYQLSAKRVPFVTINYGAVHPGRPGTAIVLEAGAIRTNVHALLARGAAITGTIRDLNGEPMPTTEVRIHRGSTEPMRFWTDDRGVYRAFGLAAGTYFVSVRPASTEAMSAPPDAEVDAALTELRRRRGSQAATRLGDAPTGTTGSTATPPRAVGRAGALAPVYFPGVFSMDDASPVTVAAGDEVRGIDVAIQLISTVQVSGAVSGVTTPASVRPRLTKLTPRGQEIRTTPLAADGRFTFDAVGPGRYIVSVPVMSSELQRFDVGLLPASAVSNLPPDACLIASEEITVGALDVTGLSLTPQPCPRLKGRLLFESSATPAPPIDLPRVRVVVTQRTVPGGPFVPVRSIPRTIEPDGRFMFGEAGQLTPADYQFSVDLPSTAKPLWSLKSITADGRDITDAALEITSRSQGSTEVTLTFTDRRSSLGGLLETTAGLPATEYTVVAFTTNQAWWSEPFRRVRAMRPGTDGNFLFDDLPPGDYYLAAVTDAAPEDVRNASVLQQMVAAAVKVAVAPGEQKMQGLRIAR